MPPALEFRAVTKVFGTRIAAESVSFDVEPGEIFGLLGPNGAGKTTLLRMALDLLKPDSGEILVLGEPVHARLKDRVGYLPEERGLYPRQRVGEVLRFLGELKGLPGPVASRRVEAWLDRVGLLETRRKRLRELSKGMQQKLQIAAVFFTEPALAVLDEPFEGLDPVNRLQVTDLLKESAARGTAILLSSHRMDQVEALCRRVFLIDRGRGVLSGEVRSIRERFADPAVLLETDRDVSGRPEVARARPDGCAFRIWLREGVSPEAFLAAILSDGVRVLRFERSLPSLDDVFLKVVRP